MEQKLTLLNLTLRFLAGGALVVLASLLARSRAPQVAGLAVLFPAVTLVAFYFLATALGPSQIRPIIAFSLYSVPCVAAFLIALLWAFGKYSVLPSFGIGIAAWLITAGLLLVLDMRFNLVGYWE